MMSEDNITDFLTSDENRIDRPLSLESLQQLEFSL